eukprot:CAMPEP_0204343970 /NCGR_PEP_ID=MMETSP0469-20131031/25276_1 /ASSEMBLY_ACC=CAM_ASM_000384 /TAXON_ID=2969 /ORGANISM="Oxyrrhis marina" /LENGTH=37 /DNA_ID= /DNA_START= /DNA_END= /DNA_ORIENTATION=
MTNVCHNLDAALAPQQGLARTLASKATLMPRLNRSQK